MLALLPYLKWLHILSAIAALGANFTYPIWTRLAAKDPASTRFDWDVFILCGDPTVADANKRGTIKGRVRLAGWSLVRRARRPVDPDRRVHQRTPQGGLHGARQQPDARRRPGDS